jgi:hypothetical protein
MRCDATEPGWAPPRTAQRPRSSTPPTSAITTITTSQVYRRFTTATSAPTITAATNAKSIRPKPVPAKPSRRHAVIGPP